MVDEEQNFVVWDQFESKRIIAVKHDEWITSVGWHPTQNLIAILSSIQGDRQGRIYYWVSFIPKEFANPISKLSPEILKRASEEHQMAIEEPSKRKKLRTDERDLENRLFDLEDDEIKTIDQKPRASRVSRMIIDDEAEDTGPDDEEGDDDDDEDSRNFVIDDDGAGYAQQLDNRKEVQKYHEKQKKTIAKHSSRPS
ncbi:hypothetical protein HK096_008414, partial [Nowakowskiella sp. JEL0078]